MKGGGNKGGSETTTTKVELPPWIEAEAQKNLGIGNEVAAIGSTPFQGNTVAGFAPQQINAMAGVNDTAKAFGMAHTPTRPTMSQDELMQALTGMRAPTNVGGVNGWSPYDAYQSAVQAMPQAQRDLIDSFFIDSQGNAPANPTIGALQYNPQVSPAQNRASTLQEQHDLRTFQQILDERDEENALTPNEQRFERQAQNWR